MEDREAGRQACRVQPPGILGVADLSGLIRQALLTPGLQDLWVRGEVTDYTRPPSGHQYFTLTEQRFGRTYSIAAVLWRSDAERLDFRLANGMDVLVFGSVDHYPAGGRTQFHVRQAKRAGEGEKHLIVERWRKELAEEGLFSVERKRALPLFPSCIGVVTSPTGAVIQDIRNVIARRFPLHLLLSPTPVQGEDAPARIARAIERLDGRADVIIVARGGGSFDDLFPFNHPLVVRAIAGSRVPVVSAIGHEVNVTLADLAADVRAPTPSAAAELAVRDRANLKEELAAMRRGLTSRLGQHLVRGREDLEDFGLHLHPRRLQRRIAERRQELDETAGRLRRAVSAFVERERQWLERTQAELRLMDPILPLSKGYALVRKRGRIVVSTSELAGGDLVELKLGDGEAEASIMEVRHGRELRGEGEGAA